jgi:hypothetical protein
MANRIETILANARITLADPKKDRWDDPTLLAHLNEAQIDFCQQTKILHARVNVPILVGNPYFVLPADCWSITRVLYNNTLIPLVSHAELDEYQGANRSRDFGVTIGDTSWEQDTGTPAALVYDRRDMLEGKVYPIPDESLVSVAYTFVGTPTDTFFGADLYGVLTSSTESSGFTVADTYGVATSVSAGADRPTLTPDYGVVASVTTADSGKIQPDGFVIIVDITDYELTSPYGTAVTLQDADIIDTIDEPYGIVDSMVESSSFMLIYYLRNPNTISSLDDTIDIPAIYDTALKFYVCGQALMNDNDAASQQKGGIQMLTYERHIQSAKAESSRDFTRASQLRTTYRSGF